MTNVRIADKTARIDAPAAMARRRPWPGALALTLGAALAFGGGGEASAQGSCPVVDSPNTAIFVDGEGGRSTARSLYENLLPGQQVAVGPTRDIYCGYGYADANNRAIVVHSPAITVVDDFVSAIEARHQGVGHLSVYVHAIDNWLPTTTVSATFSHPHPLDLGQGIRTKGDAAEYITGEDSYGIYARHTGEGRVGIDVRNVSVRTAGDYAHGVYASQKGSYRLRDNGDSTRARGAVIVNLVETDRDRDDRIRPLVGTRGDYADAVRAEYTRAAAYGHVAVTVEGYTIATGGIVPLGVVGLPRQPGDFDPDRPNVAVDFSRPYVANANYDADDPNSPQYYNVRLRDDLQQALYAGRVEEVFQELGLSPIFPSGVLQGDGNDRLRGPGAIDIRPHILVYLPVRNPDHDPNDPDSREYVAATTAPVIWNGRYFRALDEGLAAQVKTCQDKATAAERNTCFEEEIYDNGRDAGNPTGFESRGIYASHEGHGDVRIRSTDNVIRTWGADAHGIYATHTGRTVTTPGEGGTTVTTPGGGGVSITVTGGSIGTEGLDSHGVWGRHRGDSGADGNDGWVDTDDIGTGNVDISITGANIATAGDHARGVYGLIQRLYAGDDDEGNPTYVEGTGVGDVDIEITGGAIVTGGEGGAYAVHARHENKGDVAVRMTGVAVATEEHVVHGVFAEHRGSEGAVTVTVDGGDGDEKGSVATQGDRAHAVYALQSTDDGLTVRIANGATVATEGVGAHGVHAVNDGDGDLTVELNGAVGTKGAPGIVDRRQSTEMASVFVLQNGDGGLAFRMTGGAVTAEGDDAHGVQVVRSTAGGGSIDVAGGEVRAEGAGSAGVLAGFAGGGTGTVSVTVGEGASVAGGRFGILLSLSADDDGNLPTGTVRVDGTVTGGSDAGIYLSHGGMVTVGRAGTVSSSDSSTPIRAAAGDLSVTVAGTVAGDLRAPEGGDLTFASQAGGAVTGTVHDPAGPLTVEGSIGRLLYSNAATVTVAATGTMTGVEGESEPIHAEAGDLSVTVAGTVTGDLRPPEGGSLTFTSQAGGAVTGTVHDPAGPLTVEGSIGRLLYGNAATVTVAATGELTGVEGETDAIRAGAGDLSVTVAGTVAGDLRAPEGGSLTFASQAGGAVTGTVHDPAGPLTVEGSIGRLLYSNGGAVTVAAGGTLTGVEIDGVREALRSLTGDLMATISGMVMGDVLGLGAGDHTVTIEEGGAVTGTIRLAASTATVEGAAGRVWLENGGVVTVGMTGRLTGVGGEAIRSGTGDVTMTLAGTVTGDVLALGTGAHRVTVAAGGTVSGTVRVATAVGGDADSALKVNGVVGRVQLDRGGVLDLGSDGRIPGIGGVSIVISDDAPSGVGLTVKGQGQMPEDQLGGRIVGSADRPCVFELPDGSTSECVFMPPPLPDSPPPPDSPMMPTMVLGTAEAVPHGAYDEGIGADGRSARVFAPRARVYEALPSVLLGLNEAATHREWMAAMRSSNGVWASMEVGGGDRTAKRSTSTRNPAGSGIASTAGVSYRSERSGVRTGVDVPIGRNGLAGVSMHHRRGTAELPRLGIETGIDSEIEAVGTGVGVSGAWRSAEGVYLDGQAQATWYKADLTSGLRGNLKSGARGVGYAVALEAGRRTMLGGAALTPRARLTGSWVDLKNFTDSMENPVSAGEGRRMAGRAGVSLEVAPASLGGGRVFGSVDLEHAIEAKTEISVAGTKLTSEAEPTRVHLELGGAGEWSDGRYAMQVSVGYMAGRGDNRDYHGAMSLKLRF